MKSKLNSPMSFIGIDDSALAREVFGRDGFSRLGANRRISEWHQLLLAHCLVQRAKIRHEQTHREWHQLSPLLL